MTFQALHARLSELAAELATGPRGIQSPVHLGRSVERVRAVFNKGPRLDASPDRVEQAVRQAMSKGVASLRATQRFMLANVLAQTPPALKGQSIFESALAHDLLDRWEEEASARRLRTLHWRGLFRSYLQVPTGARIERLRRLLLDALPALQRTRIRPAWMETVLRHRSLLSEDPCRLYAQELLSGERSLLDDLTGDGAVPSGSWFWTTLADAFCNHLEASSDTAFQRSIEFALSLAKDRLRAHRDRMLITVFNRLARSSDRSAHNALLEFSLTVWGSPQLSTSVSWDQVRPEAKQMVCAWLAEQDLRDFYELCRGEDQVDHERLEYWLRFKFQITFSQIVLGSVLRESSRRDARDFQQRHQGRLASLIGASHNNAMLIRIGSWLFAEFSEKGNACYGYESDGLPFEASTHFTVNDLKHPRTIDRAKRCRLVHRGAWQSDIFDPALRDRGIRPDSEGGRESKPAKARIPAAIVASIPTSLLADIDRAGGRISDHRPQGGYLTVTMPRNNASIDRQLLRLGFKWSRAAGYWLE